MDDEKKPRQTKSRVTLEQLTRIRQLYREGKPIVEIARATELHRHTVRTYIKEKFEDVIADEARKESLIEGLKAHFQDISSFALKDLRHQLNASLPQSQEKAVSDSGSISTDGVIGIPGRGTPKYMVEEWARMYVHSLKYNHLMNSLRLHTKESTLWTHWDRLRKVLSAYENLSMEIWEWLNELIGNIPAEKYHPMDIDSLKKLVFGNILLVSRGSEPQSHDLFVGSGSTDGIAPIIKSRESALSTLEKDLLDEACKKQAWSALEEATKELLDSDTQGKLKGLVRKIDESLVGIELMRAFPGHCELCPV
ncbi:hypothetical protein ACFLT4_07470 [Chloroflexota bacterium]